MLKWNKVLAMTIDYLSAGVRIQDIMMLYDCAQGKVHDDIDMCISHIVNTVIPNVCKWPN